MRQKLNVLISCGPSREPLDPVRFLSNYSTGLLGVRLAEVCSRRGHHVTLVHGDIRIPDNLAVRAVPFQTARELQRILRRHIRKQDVLFMAAAVADYAPRVIRKNKINRSSKILRIDLVPTPDILQSLSSEKRHRVYVGFCVESSHLRSRAMMKLKKKNLDLIVAQQVNKNNKPFGPTRLNSDVLGPEGLRKVFVSATKQSIAGYLARSVELLAKKRVRRR